MKKTAVQWLIEQWPILESQIPERILDEALAMEKQQIIEAWNTRSKIDSVLTFTDNRTAEQYYTETYESNT
jgi:hypothetical protein